jgi:hypothetical protein
LSCFFYSSKKDFKSKSINFFSETFRAFAIHFIQSASRGISPFSILEMCFCE